MNKKGEIGSLEMILDIGKFIILAGTYTVFFIIFFSLFGQLNVYSGELKLNNAVFSLLNSPYGIGHYDYYTGNKRIGFIDYDKFLSLNNSKELNKIIRKFDDMGIKLSLKYSGGRVIDTQFINEDQYNLFKFKSNALLVGGKISELNKDYLVGYLVKPYENKLTKSNVFLHIEGYYME